MLPSGPGLAGPVTENVTDSVPPPPRVSAEELLSGATSSLLHHFSQQHMTRYGGLMIVMALIFHPPCFDALCQVT